MKNLLSCKLADLDLSRIDYAIKIAILKKDHLGQEVLEKIREQERRHLGHEDEIEFERRRTGPPHTLSAAEERERWAAYLKNSVIQ